MRTLITGGTGSIGQVLVEKLLARTDDTIVIFSRDEHKQEVMEARFKSDRLRFFLGDIRDKERVKFALTRADRVIHTAALKVVPALEYNPFEAVKTNIIGTQNLIDSIVSDDLSRVNMISLSTDKAVSPTNLYGATKLCLEKLTIAANNYAGHNRFSVVRYGNVAMSRGSVLPKFQVMMEAGQRLTVTDERMTRFWITLNEAADFVLKCLDEMQGGEIFIPKMRSFRIQDVATLMADRSCVAYTGIRPGEKIHETIISEDEAHLAFNDGDHYTIKYDDVHYKPNWLIVDPSHYKVIEKMLKVYEFKGPITSANFVMSLDELRAKLESVGITTSPVIQETSVKQWNNLFSDYGKKKGKRCKTPSKSSKTSKKK